MTNLTFLIYVDGCRFDYISEENTPFMCELAVKGSMKRAETVCGFTQGAAMLTGRYPEETNSFTWYYYSPNRSPFKWLKPFKSFGVLTRFRYYDIFKFMIRKLTTFATGRSYPDPAHIPLDLLPYFDNIGYEIPGFLDNLASICRYSGKRCLDLMLNQAFFGTRSCEQIFKPVYESIERGYPYDLYLIHVGELDILGHRVGPKPSVFRNYLWRIDQSIEKLHRVTTQHGHACNLVIASDHGMEPVIGTVDIENVLRNLNVRLHRDYVYFLDSTIARFWLFSEEARSSIPRALKRVPNGHLLSNEEKVQKHLMFRDNSYGDLIFWVNKGYVIFPNFFQSNSLSLPKGMHGYLDDSSGLILVHSADKSIERDSRDVIPLVDTFSIVSNLAGL